MEMHLLLYDSQAKEKEELPLRLRNERGSVISELSLKKNKHFQYRMVLRVLKAGLNSQLLTTPILDDVSIFYTRGTRYLSYEIQEVGL